MMKNDFNMHPYTLAQIMANFETMRATKDWAWCQQFAESVVERGIYALPTDFAMAAVFSKNEKERFAKLLHHREELLIACRFMATQIETLARHAFSDGVEEWLAKCDALNCGKRAIQQAESIE